MGTKHGSTRGWYKGLSDVGLQVPLLCQFCLALSPTHFQDDVCSRPYLALVLANAFDHAEALRIFDDQTDCVKWLLSQSVSNLVSTCWLSVFQENASRNYVEAFEWALHMTDIAYWLDVLQCNTPASFLDTILGVMWSLLEERQLAATWITEVMVIDVRIACSASDIDSETIIGDHAPYARRPHSPFLCSSLGRVALHFGAPRARTNRPIACERPVLGCHRFVRLIR